MALVRSGEEIQVNSAGVGGQYTPEIARLADGYVVVWLDISQGQGGAPGDGSGFAVKGQRYSNELQPLGEEFLVNSAVVQSQTSEKVAALSNGGFVVVWRDDSAGQGGASGDDHSSAVKAQVYDSDGERVGTEILVNTVTPGEQSAPEVAATADGFTVVWFDGSGIGDTANGGIRGRSFDNQGEPASADFLVNEATVGSQGGTKVAALEGGQVVAVWHDFSRGVGGAGGDSDGSAIKGRIFDADGEPVTNEFLVNHTTAGSQTNPQIVALEGGNFVVVWSTPDADDAVIVRAQVFKADGDSFGDEILIGYADDKGWTVAALDDGAFVAAFVNTSREEIVAGFYDASGEPHLDIRTVATDGDSFSNPLIARTSDGFVIGWRDEGEDGGDLWARAYDADGEPIGDAVAVNAQTEGNQSAPQVAGGPDGPVFVWENAGPSLNGDDSSESISLQGMTFAEASPEIGGVSGTVTFTEGGDAVVVAGSATISDEDSATLEWVKVSITAGLDSSQDKLALGEATGIGYIEGVYDAATGVLTLGSAEGATLQQYTAALRAVTYTNTSQSPTAGDRTISITASDGTGPGDAVTRTLSVTGVNDAPAGTDGTIEVYEDHGIELEPYRFGFSDVEHHSFASVIIVTLPTHGTLLYDGDEVTEAGRAFSQRDLADGLLVFKPAADATGEGYASLTFKVRDNGGTANGGVDTDASANTLTFDVLPENDPTVLGGGGTTATFTGGGSAVRVAPQLTLTDPDGEGAGQAATVKITGGFKADQDKLQLVVTPEMGEVSATYDAATGVLTLSTPEDGVSPAQMQAALRAVTYVNSSGNPDLTARTFTITAHDGFGFSNAVTSTVTVQPAPPHDDPRPRPPPAPVVDGVPVTTTTGTGPGGTPTQTVSVPVVTSSRPDTVGGNSVADIPLVAGSGTGAPPVLAVQAPAGYGLTANGQSAPQTAGNSLTDLIREIQAHTAAGSADQTSLTGGGGSFLQSLTSSTPLLVQTIVPTGAGASAQPLVINGAPATAGDPLTALVIDTRGLTAGSTLQLNNVEFAAVIGAVTVTGGSGAQTVWGDGASQTLFLGADDDVLHGGGGTDTVASAAGNDQLFGDEGSDSVSGGVGDDLVHGNAGADTVSGGEGNDRAYGGKDDDRIDGGADSDLVWGDLGNDFLHGNAGSDTVEGGLGDDSVHGGQGDDYVSGGEGEDVLLGDLGDDFIQGGIGNDRVLGGDGTDIVHGGQGDDVIYGEAGDDWLSGDRGSDTLVGGAGADRFHAYGQTGQDVVLDFNAAEGDRVVVDGGEAYTVSQGADGVLIAFGAEHQMLLKGLQLGALAEGWIVQG